MRNVAPASSGEQSKQAVPEEPGAQQTAPRNHAEALDRLLAAPSQELFDPGHTVRLAIPDATAWKRARILFTKTLFVLRYGDEPDAIVGGGLIHVSNERTPGACIQGFEDRTRYWVEAFRVKMKHDPADARLFRGAVADVDSFIASTEGFMGHDEYVAAYAAFPAWPGTCVIVGVSIPVVGEMGRAKSLRDRFLRETLPTFDLVSPEPPTSLY